MNDSIRIQLLEDLFSQPTTWDFFAAHRLLNGEDAANDELGLGPVFLRGYQRTENIQSALSDARPAQKGQPAELVVNLFRHLGGVNSALPEYFNDWIHASDVAALRDFLDLFNNSHLRLYLDAAAATAFPQGAKEDRIAKLLFGFLGAVGRAPFHSEPRIHHFATYARRTRPLAAFGDQLSDYFDLKIDVGEAPGRWIPLTVEEAAVLKVPAVYEIGFRINLRGGSWRERLRHFHPDLGKAFRPLVQQADGYLGPHRTFDLEWLLDPNDPGPQPGDLEADSLKWSYWTNSKGERRGAVSAEKCWEVRRTL